MTKPYYVTTAISYPNGAPHIGHAYEAIAADAFARFVRRSVACRLLTGTDEHGLKMAQAASAAGMTPKDFADRQSAVFRDLCDRLNISYDRFIRTTDADHKAIAQNLWSRMAERGDLYLGTYSGWYSTRDEAYFDESEITDGLAPTGNPVEWLEESTWFFRLSGYREQIIAAIESGDFEIEPKSARNKVLSMLDDIRDVSISRTSFDWGIGVPGSPDHVMYVWVDALSNYLSGADNVWPANVHIVGKDIIKFHCIYWPAFLMSAGIPLPKRVFAHGFLLNDGVKMSKSVGNVIDPFVEIDMFGADALRYFLLRDITFGEDGSYSREALVRRYNADLANGFGNLISRTFSLLAKRLNGSMGTTRGVSEEDEKLLRLVNGLAKNVELRFAELDFSRGLALWCEAVSECDRYINEQKPWDKSIPEDRLREIILCLATAIVRLADTVKPIIPETFEKINAYINGVTWDRSPPAFFPRMEINDAP